ncbi:hypothetical protein [Leifsonia sp. Root4]|uniref:hypothetical protein n=1 Tax=Leifsonia sp. Root4 TaxID=1736525 RepID=UPI000A6B64E4|nr:hypothetical protein [Leifsonia sp. Root4]
MRISRRGRQATAPVAAAPAPAVAASPLPLSPAEHGVMIERREPDAAPTPAEHRAVDADIALVVVHGMGQATQGSTLLEWAEPLLGRADWIAKYAHVTEPGLHERPIDDGWAPGVTVIGSVLSGPGTPYVVADAVWRDASADDEDAPSTPGQRRRIAILEARWSESFVPMTRSEVFRWGARFLWRVLWRMFRQFARTLVRVPSFGTRAASAATRPPTRQTAAAHVDPPRGLLRRLFSGLLMLFGVLLSAGLAVVLLALGALLTLILPLLSPLMLIPFVKKHVQNVVDALVAFVGDVGTWRERPLRAAAMRMAVQDRIVEAHGMLSPGGEIVVLAHSEGAAISAETLFVDMAPLRFNVTQLHTVGAANTLLGTPRGGFGSSREGHWVREWLANSALPDGGLVRWHNYWAIWDPFAAGPLGDSTAARAARWKGSYVLGAGDEVPGPSEHAVHNTSMPVTDHQSYSGNTAQVIDPVARVLLGDGLPAENEAAARTSVAQSVLIRRSRGANLISSVVIAAMLPFVPGVQAAVIAALSWAVAVINSVLAWLQLELRLDVATITDDAGERLDVWPAVIGVVLAAALLIWLNSLYASRSERQAVWERLSPMAAQRWFRQELLVRASYAVAAALAVALAIAAAAPVALPFAATAIAIVTLSVIIAPNVGALPFTVPERRVAEQRIAEEPAAPASEEHGV